jgi:hypothetical protein
MAGKLPLGCRAAAVACGLAAAAAPVAAAAGGAVELVGAETIKAYGDVRAVAASGEPSWVDGGFGKLNYGGNDSGNLRVATELAETGLVWQPRLGWALSGTVVALAQGHGGDVEAGLSEAYLIFKPLGGGPLKFSARAGLMWPPVSLEHGGPEWAVNDTITPSAIGSWMGEEVKVVGAELTAKATLGQHQLDLTAALFDLNDTAGALLTFRGWALHDRKALAFRSQPLPPLNEFMEYVQPRYSHPLLDLETGLFKRPGYYAKLAWAPPVPLRIELFHYDNNGDPFAVNDDLEWGWRTQFTTLGLTAELGRGFELRAQGLTGRTRMGDEMNGTDWIDMRFRAAYAMLTRRFSQSALSARLDLFDTRNQGSAVDSSDDETGWALTLAGKHTFNGWLTGLAEYLHVDSERPARLRAGLAPRQAQDQLQLAMRASW